MKDHKLLLSIVSGFMLLALGGCSTWHSENRTQSEKQTSSQPRGTKGRNGEQDSKDGSTVTGQASASTLSQLLPATQAAIDTWRANTDDTYAKGIVTMVLPDTLVVTMTLKEKMGDVDLDVLKTVLVKGVAPAVKQARKQEADVQFKVRLLNPDGTEVVQSQVTDEALKTATEQ